MHQAEETCKERTGDAGLHHSCKSIGIGEDCASNPINTTACAVAENPSAFNNKLVPVRGHYSGNFEYSMLSGDGCDALWFGYGGEGGGPPSLAIYVSGGKAGSEDADGKLILPVAVEPSGIRNSIDLKSKSRQWPVRMQPTRKNIRQVRLPLCDGDICRKN